MRTFAKVIVYVMVALLLAGTVGIIYKYTNGFNEDFKTFYVEYDGKQILTTDSKLILKNDETHNFKVKYTFDNENSEPKDYKVKIVPNVARDFDYTVDGEKYLFSKTGELTEAFGLKKEQSQFSISIPVGFNLPQALKAMNSGKNVVVPSDAVENNPYPFRLVISSYNEKVTYSIDLKIIDAVGGVVVNPDDIVFGGENGSDDKTDKPPTPDKKSYKLSWRVDGNKQNLISVDVFCPETACEGDTVNFSVSLLSDYECSVKSAEVFANGIHYAYAKESDYSSFTAAFMTYYSFTMPEANVEIVITLEKVEMQGYYSITYDTLGSGSCDSVLVYCSEAAQAGDYVMASVSLAYDCQDLQILRIVLQDADGDEFLEIEDGFDYFDFEMPNSDVVIMIYLMPI